MPKKWKNGTSKNFQLEWESTSGCFRLNFNKRRTPCKYNHFSSKNLQIEPPFKPGENNQSTNVSFSDFSKPTLAWRTSGPARLPPSSFSQHLFLFLAKSDPPPIVCGRILLVRSQTSERRRWRRRWWWLGRNWDISGDFYSKVCPPRNIHGNGEWGEGGFCFQMWCLF